MVNIRTYNVVDPLRPFLVQNGDCIVDGSVFRCFLDAEPVCLVLDFRLSRVLPILLRRLLADISMDSENTFRDGRSFLSTD